MVNLYFTEYPIIRHSVIMKSERKASIHQNVPQVSNIYFGSFNYHPQNTKWCFLLLVF